MYFPYNIHTEPGAIWVIKLPDFPQSYLSTPRANDPVEGAEGLLVSAIQGAISARKPIPEHETAPNDRALGVSALVAMKIRLSNCMLGLGVTKGELARRIGADQTRVDRILDPTHNSQIETMELAFSALGIRVNFAEDTNFAPRMLPYFVRPGDGLKTFAAKNMWSEAIRVGDGLHHQMVHRNNVFVGLLRIPENRYRMTVQNVPDAVTDANFTLTGNEPILLSTGDNRISLTAEDALIAFNHETGMLD